MDVLVTVLNSGGAAAAPSVAGGNRGEVGIAVFADRFVTSSRVDPSPVITGISREGPIIDGLMESDVDFTDTMS